MKPVERPCMPSDLQKEADEAEKRKNEALQRLDSLIREFGGDPILDDEYHHKVIDLWERRKAEQAG